MILSNSKIIELIQKGKIFIGNSEHEKDKIPINDLIFDTTSLNLHLADEFTVWRKFNIGTRVIVDPGLKGFDFIKHGKDFTKKAHADRDGCYEVRAGEFLLCRTKEYIKLPLKSQIAARVEGRSSLGRVGLGVHITAPTIHADFEGTITLEIFNHSKIPVVLRPGMKIAQLIFEKVDGIPFKGNTTFKGQTTSIGAAKEQKIKKIA